MNIRAITYLIYIVLYEALVLGGCGYAVFVLNANGWWFLFAMIMSGACFKPHHWRSLFEHVEGEGNYGSSE